MGICVFERKIDWRFQCVAYLFEILSCGPHFFPCFIQKNNTNAVEFFKGFVSGEEHWVKVLPLFAGSFTNVKDITEKLDQLNTCLSKWTFMFICSARVFQNHLQIKYTSTSNSYPRRYASLFQFESSSESRHDIC